ncbi:MAG: diaminopimelate decarboxylase [Lachnospiraceae bacterium]|jgi:diaminopimelate decarboxylase|nr:diaminopimelate decarboxylase [Lachnospiraceae bacterium]
MDKVPFLTYEQAQEIAKTYPTPFHIYDEAGLRRNARAVREAFAWNPGFREYFAVKANPNPHILAIMQEEGFGVDCASFTELLISETLGIVGEMIMFSANQTSAADYRYAHQLGAIINLDDITHIDFLEDIIGTLPETISCRYNPGGVLSLGNSIMNSPAEAKFGMTQAQMYEAFTILQEKGVKNFGIHAFIASNTITNDYYPYLARELFQLAVSLQEKTGAKVTSVNLSGGVGVAYHPDEQANDIAAIGAGVRRAFEEILVPAGMGDVAIYAEMGRFMTAPYGGLVTKAIHEKNTYKQYIGVDACAVDMPRPAIYKAYHHITVLGKEKTSPSMRYDIVGSLCESNDRFAIDRDLPPIERGDLLFIHDTGAHGYVLGNNYNGKLKSAELMLRENGDVELIRRAETPRDYLATFDCFPIFAQFDFDQRDDDR